LSQWTFIELINILFYSNSDATKLKKYIDGWIPTDFDIDDVLTQEVLFPAWNINTKKPVFFSKKAKAVYSNSNKMYSIPFGEMVWASTTNPNFFTSA
jgi:patatin-like phospholipase/acyl hydrolase